jgi:cyclopropane fatty-acyl-phospholipid synthase-like methyltransferase
MTHPPWDDSYTAEQPAPWDIGRPQQVFAGLADEGLLTGGVLDAGCGTGEHALLAATHGAQALGVDLSPTAIGRARAKAAERGLTARFEVADMLEFRPAGPDSFDVVIDSGLFHSFSDDDRPRYVDSLASLVRRGGRCYLMCFSDRQPGDWGPRRVRQDELVAAFSDGWTVESIRATTCEINPIQGVTRAQVWLATLRRS